MKFPSLEFFQPGLEKALRDAIEESGIVENIAVLKLIISLAQHPGSRPEQGTKTAAVMGELVLSMCTGRTSLLILLDRPAAPKPATYKLLPSCLKRVVVVQGDTLKCFLEDSMQLRVMGSCIFTSLEASHKDQVSL